MSEINQVNNKEIEEQESLIQRIINVLKRIGKKIDDNLGVDIIEDPLAEDNETNRILNASLATGIAKLEASYSPSTHAGGGQSFVQQVNVDENQAKVDANKVAKQKNIENGNKEHGEQ